MVCSCAIDNDLEFTNFRHAHCMRVFSTHRKPFVHVQFIDFMDLCTIVPIIYLKKLFLLPVAKFDDTI